MALLSSPMRYFWFHLTDGLAVESYAVRLVSSECWPCCSVLCHTSGFISVLVLLSSLMPYFWFHLSVGLAVEPYAVLLVSSQHWPCCRVLCCTSGFFSVLALLSSHMPYFWFHLSFGLPGLTVESYAVLLVLSQCSLCCRSLCHTSSLISVLVLLSSLCRTSSFISVLALLSSPMPYFWFHLSVGFVVESYAVLLVSSQCCSCCQIVCRTSGFISVLVSSQ